MRRSRVTAFGAALLLAACGTLQAQDGAPDPSVNDLVQSAASGRCLQPVGGSTISASAPLSRTFNVVGVGPNHGTGVDVTATADRVVRYDGSEVVVSAK